MSKWNSGAKDGGANQKKTVMPPPSEDYRSNWDSIFKKPQSDTPSIETRKPDQDQSQSAETAPE